VSWVSRGLSVLKARMIVSSVLKVDALTAAVEPIVENTFVGAMIDRTFILTMFVRM
jgi:hypothetical protein